MKDEELKKIVEEVIGNNDPFWNIPVYEIVKKIIDLPNETETSITKLLNNPQFSSKQLFDIYKCVNRVCQRIDIVLDFSKENAKVNGLLYNLPFVIKHTSSNSKLGENDIKNDNNDDIEKYNFYKNNETDIIWWVDNREQFGKHLFSFDRKKIFNLFRDYPYKLTNEEKEIFDKENPYWKDFFKDRK